MSIQSEITRISGNVSDALSAIADKGVTVPSGSNSDDLADLIALIPQGGSGSGGIIYQDLDGYLHLSEDAANVISIVDELGTAGGTIRTITGASESGGGYSADDIAFGNISGAITISGSGAIRVSAFDGCNQITSFNAPNVTELKDRVFGNCSRMTTVSLPSCTKIGANAFISCTAMNTIILPDSDLTIGNYAFRACNSLENHDFSKVSTINSHTFRECSTKSCQFNPVTVNDSGFRDAKYFDIEYFPRLTTINGTYAFAGPYDPDRGSSATSFVAPLLTTIQSTYALSYNDTLVSIDIGNLTSIPSYTMRDNQNLEILVLRKSALTSLANIDAFTDTPFANGGSGGTLYVPNDLISTYQSATNWSTILAYTNNQIKSIESTHTDPTAPIDLTLYYADGTLIPST